MGFLDAYRNWRYRRELSAAARRMTSAEFVETLKAARDELLKQLHGMTPERADWSPGPDRWSVGQMLDCLSATEGAMLECAAKLAKETKPLPYRPSPPKKGRAFEELYAELQRLRKETLNALCEMNWPVRSKLKTRHPAYGPLDAGQWLILIWHNETEITRKIREVMEAKDFPRPKV